MKNIFTKSGLNTASDAFLDILEECQWVNSYVDLRRIVAKSGFFYSFSMLFLYIEGYIM